MKFTVKLADDSVLEYNDKDTFSIEHGALKVIKGDGEVEIFSPAFWRRINQPSGPEPIVQSVRLPE